MKKIVLPLVLLVAMYGMIACNKQDDTRTTSTLGVGIGAMGLSFNKVYPLYIMKDSAGNTYRDSTFLIFRSNGSLTEVKYVFDSGSYTYPDSLTYVVNPSFVQGVTWNHIPNVQLLTIYPTYDTNKKTIVFPVFEYLRKGTVNMYKATDEKAGNIYFSLTSPALTSNVIVYGQLVK